MSISKQDAAILLSVLSDLASGQLPVLPIPSIGFREDIAPLTDRQARERLAEAEALIAAIYASDEMLCRLPVDLSARCASFLEGVVSHEIQ